MLPPHHADMYFNAFVTVTWFVKFRAFVVTGPSRVLPNNKMALFTHVKFVQDTSITQKIHKEFI